MRSLLCGRSKFIINFLRTSRSTLVSDLVGLSAIWRGWLDPICFGGGSANLIGGAEWILKLWTPGAPVLYPIRRRRLRRKDQ